VGGLGRRSSGMAAVNEEAQLMKGRWGREGKGNLDGPKVLQVPYRLCGRGERSNWERAGSQEEELQCIASTPKGQKCQERRKEG